MLEPDKSTESLPEQSLGGDVTKTALLKQATKEALWYKVLVLLDKPECQTSSFMIAEYLNAEVSDVMFALEAMEHIGWIEKVSGKYARVSESLKLDTKKIYSNNADINHSNMLMVQQILQSVTEADKYKFNFQFMLTDQEVVNEYLKRKEALDMWFIESSDLSKKDTLIEEAWIIGSALKLAEKN